MSNDAVGKLSKACDYRFKNYFNKFINQIELYHDRSSNPRQTVSTSSKQRISDYHSHDTYVDTEEKMALVYKKTRGVGKIYDPHGIYLLIKYTLSLHSQSSESVDQQNCPKCNIPMLKRRYWYCKNKYRLF
ncbi:hypothetical protein BpHYR1_011303 [Brachionus plicatilis]|uniref:Uncharacterized protein n=1 Tax=Brachionus plicatilis TaxID=10195 RepID=A0A3M7S1H2_BRAPC|nr:hypothetical protein BpHYR1_011303 [Brachionus plicatilis]